MAVGRSLLDLRERHQGEADLVIIRSGENFQIELGGRQRRCQLQHVTGLLSGETECQDALCGEWGAEPVELVERRPRGLPSRVITSLECFYVSGRVETVMACELENRTGIGGSAYMRSVCLTCAAGLVAFITGLAMAQQPLDGEHTPTEDTGMPTVPPGALRLVNYVHHAGRVAICAEEVGPAIEWGGRLIPRTRVWIQDGTSIRRVATAPGTCDPAWSPDGAWVAVAAPDGVWILSGDLHVTMHLVDTRHTETPGNEFDHRTVSDPQWAPNGSRLAFLVSNGGTSWVEMIDARTGEALYNSDPETYEFAWGADSRSLRFGSRVARVP